MVDPDAQPLVIDNGSGSCKVGFAGDDTPRSVFPSIVGRPPHSSSTSTAPPLFVGDDALSRSGLLSLEHPVEHGVVSNWDLMEKVWHHAFSNIFRVMPENHPVMMSEVPFNPTSQRETSMSIMFESFRVPAFYVQYQAILSFYATGRTSGVVLESGAGVSHVMPIYEGYTLTETIQRVDLGGRDVTNYLAKCLEEKRDEEAKRTTTPHSSCWSHWLLAQQIKEKLCFVAADFEEELQKERGEIECEYETPDGQVLTIGSERFCAPEILFDPSRIGLSEDVAVGLPQLVFNCLKKCPLDIRKDLFWNIILTGGNTHLAKAEERMQSEIEKLLVGTHTRAHIRSPPERTYCCWIGGSILASLSTMQNYWILKEEYEDAGSSIIHRKCY